jgi:flagellar hook-length control protein FliK
VEKRKTADSPTGAIRDFEPLAVLLNASGVTPERTTAFLNSLKADYPEGKVPMGDLTGRIRTLIMSETGGDGQIHLEPGSRLTVESGLTLWGLSPKDVERVLSLSSTDNGPVDVEKFLKMTALHRKPLAGNPKETSKSESEPGKDGRAGRAVSAENSAPADTQKTRSRAAETGRASATKAPLASAGGDPAIEHSSRLPGTGRPGTILSFKADDRRAAPATGTAGLSDGRTRVTGEPVSRAVESPAAKQASDGMTVQHETPQKSTPPSSLRKAESEEQGVTGPGRNKGPNEGDAPRRAAKEAAFEDGTPSLETRSYLAAGAGPQQTPAKPAVAPAQPLSSSEDPVPAHVAAQVSRQISRAVLNGDSTLRMHLSPPELGTLKVQLEWSQDVLKIEMVTDRHQAKDLILASVSELKETLGDQGFRVEKMEVVVNDPSGQPMHQSSREHRDPPGPGLRQQEDSGFLPNEKKGEGGPEQPSPLGGHLVDLVA